MILTVYIVAATYQVLYGSRKKQELFPCTKLCDCFLEPRRTLFIAQYGKCVNTTKNILILYRVNNIKTLCLFHLHRHVGTCLWRWNRQSVPKRQHIKFRRRGITQKKPYNIQNTAKVWNQEYQKSNLKHSLRFGKLYFHINIYWTFRRSSATLRIYIQLCENIITVGLVTLSPLLYKMSVW